MESPFEVSFCVYSGFKFRGITSRQPWIESEESGTCTPIKHRFKQFYCPIPLGFGSFHLPRIGLFYVKLRCLLPSFAQTRRWPRFADDADKHYHG